MAKISRPQVNLRSTDSVAPSRYALRQLLSRQSHKKNLARRIGASMGQLIDGEWRNEPPPASGSGEFVRAPSTFRNWIKAGGDCEYPAMPGRYHLYAARACPWCHRTLIARVAKRLENIVSISFVEP